ncbi:hypothetical protein C9374_001199 [Naegleria lovaniensis]|uniref:Endonuclease/exonuclease/phosphatase domain-containing protein n=1 Tax=Naegleria lovaniensis TaxID=51637 RepID=A0AA88GRM9_NAELO|nr:uncharacterized protein C9374_001199 [Naegleria lovaniensis]KAG2387605.1 hypothetical protein C9374_001199 [Naegleria lovaniensis]
MGKRQGLRKVVFFERDDSLESNNSHDTASSSEGRNAPPTHKLGWKERKWYDHFKNGDDAVSESIVGGSDLSLFQFNILHDDLNSEIYEKIYTKIRFDYILHTLLPTINADVICLNEVGNHFLKRLLDECSHTWMKELKYNFISHMDRERFEILNPHLSNKKSKSIDEATQMTVEKGGFVCLIISKIPFVQSHNYYYQNDLVYSRRPATMVTLANNIIIMNVHLKAYKECHPIRKKQLKCIYALFRVPRVAFKSHENSESAASQAILSNENRFTYHYSIENVLTTSKQYDEKKEFLENFPHVKSVILCGDLNFNHDFEEHNISDYGMEDVYAKLHPDLVGKEESYTFDYMKNPIVNLYSETSRGRCRYDRILLFNRPTTLTKNQDHHSTLIGGDDGGGALHAYQCEILENKAFKDNIFASDHYALLTKFTTSNVSNGQAQQRQDVIDA